MSDLLILIFSPIGLNQMQLQHQQQFSNEEKFGPFDVPDLKFYTYVKFHDWQFSILKSRYTTYSTRCAEFKCKQIPYNLRAIFHTELNCLSRNYIKVVRITGTNRKRKRIHINTQENPQFIEINTKKFSFSKMLTNPMCFFKVLSREKKIRL